MVALEPTSIYLLMSPVFLTLAFDLRAEITPEFAHDLIFLIFSILRRIYCRFHVSPSF